MTPEKESALRKLLNEQARETEAKFRKGDAEHESDIDDLTPAQLAEEIIHEAIDLYVYAYKLREKLKKIIMWELENDEEGTTRTRGKTDTV